MPPSSIVARNWPHDRHDPHLPGKISRCGAYQDVRRDPEGRLSLSARLPLHDLSLLIGEDLSEEDVHTVGGLVYAKVGGAPRVGDSATVGAHRLTIERVHRRRIVRVTAERDGTNVERT